MRFPVNTFREGGLTMKERKKYDAVICGYYGFGNTGDDAVLSVITDGVRERMPGAAFAVIAKDRKKSAADCRTDTVGRYDVIGIVRAMRRAKTFILGGGSLLQDETSVRSLCYYAVLFFMGKLICRNAYVYANGIGELKGRFSSFTARAVIRFADGVSVRDPGSLTFARKTADNPNTVLSADPVYLTEVSEEDKRRAREMTTRLTGGQRFFAISLRDTKNSAKCPEGEIVSFCKRQESGGKVPVFVPMQEEYDGEVCQKIAAECGGVCLPVCDARTLLAVFMLEEAEFAVGMRLHFLLLSLMAGKPAVALSCGYKTDVTFPYCGGRYIIPAHDFTAHAVSRAVEKAKKNTDAEKLRNRCLELRRSAQRDIDRLCAVMPDGGTETKDHRTLVKTLYSKSE